MTDSAKQKAYEAEKARLDARKTKKNVKCTPPNKQCGGRCIPPSWDCRLKNEGSDKHLMAVKTDPLKGAASIQRGFKRLAKGVVTGNIAEVQSGRGTITRGIVTFTPGNLQQKKELRQRIDQRTRFIGTVALLGVGGYALHTQAKKYGPYKKHVGRKIDIAARNGYNGALDRMPILGGIRENNRRAAATNTARTAESILKGESLGGVALSQKLGEEGAESLSSMIGDKKGAAALNKAIGDQDTNSRKRAHNFLTWDIENRTTFLGVQRATIKQEGFGDAPISIYAEPAAQSFLRDAYGLKGSDSGALKTELGNQLRQDKADYIRFAKQSGFKIKGGESDPHVDPEQAGNFAKFATRKISNEAVREAATDHIQELVSKGGSQGQANRIYTNAVQGFNSYYKTVEDRTRISPGVPPLPDQRNLAEQVDIARSRYLASKMKGVNLSNMGPAVGQVVRRGYYATNIASQDKNATYSLTAGQFQAAATEIAGRPVPTLSEAQSILKNAGFTGATYAKTAQTKLQKTPSKKLTKQQRLRTTTELAKKYREQGLSDVAAMKAAVKEMKERGDGLSSYEAAFLEARYDFKEGNRLGKACGNSYIPKKHKCTKGKEGATTTTTTAEKAKSSTKSISYKTFAKVALAAGVTTAAVMIISDAGTFANKMNLPNTPKTREAYTPFKKKGMSLKEAANDFYDAKVKEEGWKVGELVYSKPGTQVSSHFAVYLGKEKGVHKFGELGVSRAGSKSGQFDINDAGVQVFVRAPKEYRPKSKSNLTEEQIINRAEMLTQFDLKYDRFKDNCETWARAVIGDTPRSKQADKLSPISKALSNMAQQRFRARSEAMGEVFDDSKATETAKEVAQKLSKLEGLGVFDEMIAGIKKRRATETAGEDLLEQLMRGDSLDGVLISPKELLANAESAAERVVLVRNYLMLHVAILKEATPAKD